VNISEIRQTKPTMWIPQLKFPHKTRIGTQSCEETKNACIHSINLANLDVIVSEREKIEVP